MRLTERAVVLPGQKDVETHLGKTGRVKGLLDASLKYGHVSFQDASGGELIDCSRA